MMSKPTITTVDYDYDLKTNLYRWSDGGVTTTRSREGVTFPPTAEGRLAAAKEHASEVYQVLLAAETNADNAPDMRRTLGEERQALHAVMSRNDLDAIVARTTEGARVAKLWGVEV